MPLNLCNLRFWACKWDPLSLSNEHAVYIHVHVLYFASRSLDLPLIVAWEHLLHAEVEFFLGGPPYAVVLFGFSSGPLCRRTGGRT